MDTFLPSEYKTTFIKIHDVNNETSIDSANVWDDLDLCCPKYDPHKIEKLLKTVNDSVERIRYITFICHPSECFSLSASLFQYFLLKLK